MFGDKIKRMRYTLDSMKFKFTPVRVILGCGILVFALTGIGFIKPWTSEADGFKATDQCLLDELKANPGNATAHYMRAILHTEMADYPTARLEFSKARAIDPSGAFAGGVVVLDYAEEELKTLTKAPHPVHKSMLIGIGLTVLSAVSVIFLVIRRRQAKKTLNIRSDEASLP